MATLNELTYDLLNTARGGVLSDDDTISIRQVQFWIHNTRALLIRQDIQKKRSLSANIIQMLPCLDIDLVDASSCPCTVPIGCTVLRTRNAIPKPIEVDDRDLIIKVAPIGITDRSYTLVPFTRATWTGYNKYAKHNPKVFYFNGYIWIIGSVDPIEKITVYGVFEDPTELAQYVDCSGDQCYNDDMEYPISSWMINMLDKLITEEKFRIIVTAPSDTAGDAKSNTEITAQK